MDTRCGNFPLFMSARVATSYQLKTQSCIIYAYHRASKGRTFEPIVKKSPFCIVMWRFLLTENCRKLPKTSFNRSVSAILD